MEFIQIREYPDLYEFDTVANIDGQVIVETHRFARDEYTEFANLKSGLQQTIEAAENPTMPKIIEV